MEFVVAGRLQVDGESTEGATTRLSAAPRTIGLDVLSPDGEPEVSVPQSKLLHA